MAEWARSSAPTPGLLRLIAIAGATFLFAYAGIAAWRAIRPGRLTAKGDIAASLPATLAQCLAFTWLNPHVYLDTVVLVGGFSAALESATRPAFAAGAMASSFVWFFGLGYGASLLAPVFVRPTAWRILDGTIAVVMAALGLSLLLRAGI